MLKKCFIFTVIIFISVFSLGQLKIFSTEYRFVNDESCPVKLVDTWGKVYTSDGQYPYFQIAHEVQNKTDKTVVSWEARAVLLDKYNNHLFTLKLTNDDTVEVEDDDISRNKFDNCMAWQCDLVEMAYVYITYAKMDDQSEWKYNFDTVFNKLTTNFNLSLRKEDLFTYVEKNRGVHERVLGIKTQEEDELSLIPRNYKSFELMMTLDEIKAEIAKSFPDSLAKVYSPLSNTLSWDFELFLVDRENLKTFISDLEAAPAKLHLNKIEFRSRPEFRVVESISRSSYSIEYVEERNLHGLCNVITTIYYTQGSIDGVKQALLKRYGEPTYEIDLRRSDPTSAVRMIFNDSRTAIKVVLSQGSSADYYAVEKTSDVAKILTLLKTRDLDYTVNSTKDRNYYLAASIPFKVTKVEIEYYDLKKTEKKKNEKIELDF